MHVCNLWSCLLYTSSTGGVAQVAVLGGDIKEYQVLLDPARMKHYNVTLAELSLIHIFYLIFQTNRLLFL